LTAAVVPPPAAAERLQANVVSASPNDVQPGEPQTVVFYLYTPSPKPWSPDGKRFAGVNDVEVVLHGQGQTRRFAATDLGDGRYSAEITFPEAGGWSVRAGYGSGLYGAGDEVALGKGGIYVAADGVPPQPGEQSPASSNGWPWTRIGVIVAALLALGLVAAMVIRSTSIGRRRRVAPTT
jgi:hypothetical protein